MSNPCPYNAQGKHYYTNTVASGSKFEYIPVEYGKTAADTLYKRVEFSYMSCNCGAVSKQHLEAVRYEEGDRWPS